jgi:Ca2+:H+ antiporter
VGRKVIWASLALAPITILIDVIAEPSKTVLFVLAAVALVPLAWLIGEATEHAAEHTGPRIGGLLNASFGNAPELIIALFAVHENLPNVVRGSLAGSVISNILLVLGFAMAIGPDHAQLDRRSLVGQLGLVGLAVALFLIPSIPGFSGDSERDSLVYLSIPVSITLLLVYLALTARGLRRGRADHLASGEAPSEHSWSLEASLGALGLATVTTAVISEILVHSLEDFADAAGLSDFFISAVIVAIVGNAAEHGGAVVVAHRGKMRLATEIAISSSAQVALLVTPSIMLLSLLFAHPLPLSFRWVEILGMGGAALFVAGVVSDGRSRRWEGFMLIAVYVGVAAGFYAAGDR